MIDDTLRALADPTRREILRNLRQGDLSAGDIAARFELSAPSISHHLNVLKEAGLITGMREGRHIIYSLNSTVFQEIMQQLMDQLGTGERS